MRKSTIAAAAVFSSAALVVVGAPTASQAFTQKELSVCYTNETPNTVQDLEFVADGPSYKTTTLDSGDCTAWDVRPGQYKITVEDVEEFLQGLEDNDQCDTYEENGIDKHYVNMEIAISRMGGEDYRAFPYAAVANGEVTTNVKKDRSTAILMRVFCGENPPLIPSETIP